MLKIVKYDVVKDIECPKSHPAVHSCGECQCSCYLVDIPSLAASFPEISDVVVKSENYPYCHGCGHQAKSNESDVHKYCICIHTYYTFNIHSFYLLHRVTVYLDHVFLIRIDKFS